MKNNKITSVCTVFCAKIVKHSPKILTIAGVALSGAAIATTIHSTIKAQPIMENANKQKDIIEAAKTAGKTEDSNGNIVDYNDTDYINDLRIVSVQTIVKTAKVYVLPAILFSLATTSYIASYHILKKRNASLVAAYAALNTVFLRYRNNVKTVYGEDVDHRFMTNEVTKEEVIDPDTGEVTEEYKDKKVSDLFNIEWSSDTTVEWEKSHSYNLIKLNSMQETLNYRLKINGFVTVSDVLAEVGVSAKGKGEAFTLGWIHTEENPANIQFNVTYEDVVIPIDTARGPSTKIERKYFINIEPQGVITDKI